MKDLTDYVPEQIQFKLPASVHFPEILFADCICMDDVKKKLSEHFVAVQEKDVIANRVMDDYEVSTIRANYGEIAEEKMPELENTFERLKAEFNSAKKDFEAKISSLNTQFKDLVYLAKKGIKDHPLNMSDTFRIPVLGYYLYYSWVNDAFSLALVQEIPKHEYNDLFNSGGRNEESFKALGYELPDVKVKDTRVNVRQFKNTQWGDIEVWEENGFDVWMEQWTEDFLDESTGEVIPTKRHEWHKISFEESPWRKEDEQTDTQEGEAVEISGESEE